jgi:hypothetical protein
MTHDVVSMVIVSGGPECNHTVWKCPVCGRVYVQAHEHESDYATDSPKPCKGKVSKVQR